MSGAVERARTNWVGLAIVELWRWIVLIGLTFLASIKNMVLMGLIFFVVPGLILLAAPNVLLLAVLAQVPRVVRAITRSWSLTALAAALMVAAACAPAWIVDRRLDAEARVAQASDFGDLAAPRNVKVLGLVAPGLTTCSSDCNNMLTEGRVQAIAVPVSTPDGFYAGLTGPVRLYRRGDQAACEAAAGAPAPYDGYSRGCIIAETASAAPVDAILALTPIAEATAEARGPGPRFNPFNPGALKEERLDLWTCGRGQCAHTARRTHVRQERPFPFPLIGGEGPMVHELALARLQWEANPVDIEALVERWAGLPARAPGAGRMQRFLPLVENLVAAAQGAASTDPETVEQTLRTLEEQQAPLTRPQIEAVARLLGAAKPRHGGFAFGWSRHPEALAAVIDQLGPALAKARDPASLANVERAIAELPSPALAKLAPQVLARLDEPGWLRSDGHDLGFLIRLSEFGPRVARPIGAALRPAEAQASQAGPGKETAEALAMALCRLGPDARALEADVRAAAQWTTEHDWARSALLWKTVARMDGGASENGCYDTRPFPLADEQVMTYALRARDLASR